VKTKEKRKNMAKTTSLKYRPMNVHVAPHSSAERAFRAIAGLPGLSVKPQAIVAGIPKTPAHNLHFHGGKTIADLHFKNFYVGAAAAWNPDDIQAIDRCLTAAMSDRHLNNVMAQYFPGQDITTTSSPSEVLPGPTASVISQGDIEALLRSLHTHGKLDGFDLGSTVFNFMLPSGTVLNTDAAASSSPGSSRIPQARRRPIIPHDEDDSLNGLGGYHGSLHAGRGGYETLYYAVGVFSERLSDGTTNGIPVFDEPWKNVVATFYHELNEARTDADVADAIAAGDDPDAVKFLGWTSNQGEECGDFPVFEANPLTLVFQEVPLTDGSRTVPVQFQYSNAAEGPEGPIAQPHKQARHQHTPRHGLAGQAAMSPLGS